MRNAKKVLAVLMLTAMMVAMLSACGCEHQWAAATCTSGSICELCGAEEGEALGHDWKDATCEDAMTCARCDATEGEALGHDWKDATCEEPMTCNRCNVTEGDPAGHTLAGATVTEAPACEVCGITPEGAMSLSSAKFVGEWEAWGVQTGDEFSVVPGEAGYCIFNADGTGKVGTPDSEYDITWRFIVESDGYYMYSIGSLVGGISLEEGDVLTDKLILISEESDESLVFQKVQ